MTMPDPLGMRDSAHWRVNVAPFTLELKNAIEGRFGDRAKWRDFSHPCVGNQHIDTAKECCQIGGIRDIGGNGNRFVAQTGQGFVQRFLEP